MIMSRKRKKASKESSSEDDSSSEDEKKKKKRKKERKRIKKEKRKKHKKDKKKRKNSESSDSNSLQDAVESGPSQDRNKMCPMTKEEWEKQQSIVRRVYDEETGRSRLIKGDGEVLEEIVSKSRHQEINRKATMGDGLSFQSKIGLLKK